MSIKPEELRKEREAEQQKLHTAAVALGKLGGQAWAKIRADRQAARKDLEKRQERGNSQGEKVKSLK